MMMKGVPLSHFAKLRAALKSARLNWYAIDQDGHIIRATDQFIDAAFEEYCWGHDPKFVFALGDPQDVTFVEIVSGRTERTAFCRDKYDCYMFVLNFDEIPSDGVKIEDVYE